MAILCVSPCNSPLPQTSLPTPLPTWQARNTNDIFPRAFTTPEKIKANSYGIKPTDPAITRLWANKQELEEFLQHKRLDREVQEAEAGNKEMVTGKQSLLNHATCWLARLVLAAPPLCGSDFCIHVCK